MVIKALSVKEPWASMIRNGEKTIETRRTLTSYRGPLLIAASKNPPGPYAGMAIAICELIGCREMTMTDEPLAGVYWRPGLKAWFLKNVRPIKPFPVRGQIYLYDVELPEGVEL